MSCCSIRTCLTRLVAVAICAISSSASAALVTYSSAGSFDGGPFVSDSAITLGGVTLNYSGLIPTTVDANPSSFISLGTFTATGLGTADLTGRDFDLRITQTAPGAGTQTIDADLSGTITGSVGSGSSSLLITLNQSMFTLGGVTYTIDDTTLQVPAPGQSVSITATAVVPEPAAIGLLVAGLPLLLRRRRA